MERQILSSGGPEGGSSWCGWCLCSNAVWPTGDTHWVALAETILVMTLLGLCDGQAYMCVGCRVLGL